MTHDGLNGGFTTTMRGYVAGGPGARLVAVAASTNLDGDHGRYNGPCRAVAGTLGSVATALGNRYRRA
jgi:hypothetical protein